MGYPDTFEGYKVDSADTWNEFKRDDIKPKPFGDYDIDIKIECCGVCGSDVHTLRSGWGASDYPVVVGHEIVGKVVKVGSKVTEFKEGDRAGVGAQIGACGECYDCKNFNENYCPKGVDTYNAKWEDGSKTWGGYANYIRSHEDFTFKIPEGLESKVAAPMLCAGATVFSPLKRNHCGPGKKVAIVGIGGLGHFALIFAKALGAEVTAISHSASKKEDALKLGASKVVLSGEKDWWKAHEREFDLIVCTANAGENFPLSDYLKTLKAEGRFNLVGIPEGNLPTLAPFDLVASGVYISGSHIGSKKEINEMLALAAKEDLKGWIEEIPISSEGCNKAVSKLHDGSVRYRFVLTGHQDHFGTK